MGSLLRTADGLGVEKVYLSGYTPYPLQANDARMPHEAKKIDAQIHKTALGAEISVNWQRVDDIVDLFTKLRALGYSIVALEQAEDSQQLPTYNPPDKIAIVLGREVEGLEEEVRTKCDTTLEIPMHGQKESFNVVQAAAMTLYHCTFY